MVARTITPALAQALVVCWEVTWAVTVPSAASGSVTRWKASAVPQMSPPPAVSVHDPLTTESWPGGRAPPMSLQLHPLGQRRGGACSVACWTTLSKVATVRLSELLASLASPATNGPGRVRATWELGT